jgi:hypothetical protein
MDRSAPGSISVDDNGLWTVTLFLQSDTFSLRFGCKVEIWEECPFTNYGHMLKLWQVLWADDEQEDPKIAAVLSRYQK